MLTAVDVTAGPGFSVAAVSCQDQHPRWSPPEQQGGYRLVLVRRGRFRRRAAGCSATIDPTLGYLGMPGDEESFAHPAGGDECTCVSISPGLWRLIAGDCARPGRTTVYVDARLELAHRRLIAAAASGDTDHALAGALLDLAGAAVSRTIAGATPASASATPASPSAIAVSPSAAPASPSATAACRDRALVAAAREAVAADLPAAAGLFPLAEFLGVSPYRLSRAFPRELGVTLTYYRNRVRVSKALQRLATGERSLAVLAADLGFADQAHLTRTIRDQAGHTPAELRRLLCA